MVFYELQLCSFQWLRIVRYVGILCLILVLTKTIRRLWGSNIYLTTEKVWLSAKTTRPKDICRCFFLIYKAFHSIFSLPVLVLYFGCMCMFVRCTYSGLTNNKQTLVSKSVCLHEPVRQIQSECVYSASPLICLSKHLPVSWLLCWPTAL